MKIPHVRQNHTDGCFVACVAMLLGVSYKTAYHALFPTRQDGKAGIQIENAFYVLKKLGFKPKPSYERRIKKLHQNSVIIIRWIVEPTISHAAIWNARRKKTQDPLKHYSRDVYESQIESIFSVDIAAGRKKWKKRRR